MRGIVAVAANAAAFVVTGVTTKAFLGVFWLYAWVDSMGAPKKCPAPAKSAYFGGQE